MPFDLSAHLTRQMVFSKATFGPGPRTEGVLEHIAKELEEVRSDALAGEDTAPEWVDIVILALDGLTRAIYSHDGYRIPAELAAERACRMILLKQGVNERRTWPDWRTAEPGKAIEHDRTGETEIVYPGKNYWSVAYNDTNLNELVTKHTQTGEIRSARTGEVLVSPRPTILD